MKISIEQLMYSNFIKYETMQRMTLEAFSHSNANSVNVYIDMSSLFRSLYQSAVNLSIENYTSITSSIINLCAHIRSYYENRHRVETKIFLVHSRNTPYNSKLFYNNYNAKNELTITTNKMVTDLINKNIEVLETLCPYLHDIFLVNVKDDTETAVVVYNLICKQEAAGNMNPNIVITRDLYMYQLPAIHPNTVLFRVLKKNGQDNSFIVNHDNSMIRFIKDSRNKDDEILYDKFDPAILSLLIALTNLSCRNIKSIFSISKGINILIEGINNKVIINGYNSDIDYIINMLNTVNVNKMEIVSRFKAIDLIYQHSIYINSSACARNMDSVINLYDPETVKGINNIYFRDNPLDLNRI